MNADNERVFLLFVSPDGEVRQPYSQYLDLGSARETFNDAIGKQSNVPVAARDAIHAMYEASKWPRDLEPIETGLGLVDRSCDPERCDCKALGFPTRCDP